MLIISIKNRIEVSLLVPMKPDPGRFHSVIYERLLAHWINKL